MVTPLGKELRIIRLNFNEILKDMANKIGITPSYLSSIENGKRTPTLALVNKIIRIYGLNEEESLNIQEALYKTINEITISSKNLNKEHQDLGLVFVRKFNDLDSEQINEILSIISKKK